MILCSGAFDGFHSGHLAYLQAAKALHPDVPLLVAVAPDSYIRVKKRREPRWSQAQRARVVAGLRCVDRVIEHDEPSVAPTILRLRPVAFVKGLDWLHTLPHDVARACVEVGTAVLFTETEELHGSGVDWGAIGASL